MAPATGGSGTSARGSRGRRLYDRPVPAMALGYSPRSPSAARRGPAAHARRDLGRARGPRCRPRREPRPPGERRSHLARVDGGPRESRGRGEVATRARPCRIDHGRFGGIVVRPPLVERPLPRRRLASPLARYRRAFGWTADLTPARVRAAAAAGLAGTIILVQARALAENRESGRVNWRRAAGYLEFEAGKGRRGEILAADGWAYFCLSAQMTRRQDPRDVTLTVSVAELKAKVATSPDGWVARAPHYRNVPAEIDAFLRTTSPWAIIDEADDVHLYRFEKGTLLAP